MSSIIWRGKRAFLIGKSVSRGLKMRINYRKSNFYYFVGVLTFRALVTKFDKIKEEYKLIKPG